MAQKKTAKKTQVSAKKSTIKPNKPKQVKKVAMKPKVTAKATKNATEKNAKKDAKKKATVEKLVQKASAEKAAANLKVSKPVVKATKKVEIEAVVVAEIAPAVDATEVALGEKRLTKQQVTAIEKLIKQGKDFAHLHNYLKTASVDYKMSETYEPKSSINHKVLGLGYVMSVNNNRMEVMFRDGIKQLIMNYGK